MMMRSAVLAFIFACLPLRGDDAGRKLYADQCARCHGSDGQGTKKVPQALAGDRSVLQLAELIQKTMPEDSPGSLSLEDSKKIAADIHGRFYSELARARGKPARIELARLTVRQYRLAVADVIASFRPSVPLADKHGLAGDYFNKTFQMDLRGTGLCQRTDANVDFDYGTASPLPGKLDHHTYSIQWKGSLIAPETGEYEFTVSTPHAGRLFVNDLKVPLVDAWVKSGKETEFKGRIALVGGKAYPLRLDYSKGRQGKKDNEKNPPPEPPPVKSWIKLQWVRPHGTPEAVPSRLLVPTTAVEQFVCTAKFPPDDRSIGWERGTAISKEWDAATTESALDAAASVSEKLNALAGAKDGADYEKKLKAFAATFAERAFRRPLTPEQKAIVIDKQFAAVKDPMLAVKRSVLLTLKSPFFLYREVAGGDAYDTAARLSFGLWDSIPDAELLKAAAAGQLATRDHIVKQAERMLKDPRGQAKLRDFLLTWLRVDDGHDLMKDAARFPGFDAATIADLKTSLELFLDDVLASPGADFRQLLLSNEIYVNARLAKFYGTEPPKEGFAKATLDPGQRAGVLTHPYLMASFANNFESSPIHRGVFLARGILGVSLRPPPEAVAPLAPSLHPDLSTRERVALQTKAAACMTCHGVINPLGFTLEHFDAVGQFRDVEHGKKIDASGSYKGHDGKAATVNGARELAEFLAKSTEAQEAFAEQMFHHLVQQPVRAYGANVDVELRKSFVKNEFNIRKLAVEVMATSALTGRGK